MIRTFNNLKSAPKNCSYSEDNFLHHKCGLIHCESLINYPRDLLYSEQLMIDFISETFLKSKEDVKKIYLSFENNSFGILDELLGCIGSGVFPAGAMLNHSCVPNCVLRYNFFENVPVLEIVALTSIEMGTELCHSYIDCCLSRKERIQKLCESYHFICKCPRCSDTFTERVPAQVTTLADPFQVKLCIENFIKEGKKEKATMFDTDERENHKKEVNDVSSSSLVEVDKLTRQIRVTPDIYQSVLNKSSYLCLQYEHSQEDPIETVQYLEEAVGILHQVCGPYHIELYKARGLLLSAYLLNGDYKKSCVECMHLVNFLTVVYVNIPNHPLLGLQLYTLADLMSYEQHPQAIEAYRWAYCILKITSSPNSEMISKLKLFI